MKKNVMSIVSLCFFTVLTVPAFAGNPWDVEEDLKTTNEEVESDARVAQRETDSNVSGKVLSVNVAENSLTVKANGDVGTYFVEEHTYFTIVSSVGEISPGDTVSINYYTFNEKNFAKGIVLESSEYAKKTKIKSNEMKTLVD